MIDKTKQVLYLKIHKVNSKSQKIQTEELVKTTEDIETQTEVIMEVDKDEQQKACFSELVETERDKISGN